MSVTAQWAVGSVIIFLVQSGIHVWQLTKLCSMKSDWLEVVPKSATVLTVQMDGFWGPVHVLVPKRCSRFEELDRLVAGEDIDELENESSLDDGINAHAEHDEAGMEHDENDDLPSQQGSATDSKHISNNTLRGHSGGSAVAATERRLVADRTGEEFGVYWNSTHVTVRRCGKKLVWRSPSQWQQYLALTWTGGHDSVDELRRTRERLMYFIFVMLCLTKLGKVGCQYGLNSPLLGRIVAPVETFIGFAIVSLFNMFWYEDFYVISYIPGKAILSFVGALVVSPLIGFVVACIGGEDTGFIACIGVLAVSTFVFLVPVWLPLFFGYTVYSIQYMWSTDVWNLAQDQFEHVSDVAQAANISVPSEFSQLRSYIKPEAHYLQKGQVFHAEFPRAAEEEALAAQLLKVNSQKPAAMQMLKLSSQLIMSTQVIEFFWDFT
eukprot:CAMPEP_0176024760 /NCGR_PEP_ID=MMETSP0120_2-20121206/12104_1 /TAXON_ID=160619 /ORGANISM="Kryptoperidinium foliaceum, Strain CCMP 1326" /LENGTH=435 /DNA_ID=CAMNT_0017357941 /DNA_START=33 /DNA_END=1336 /DNA_ORIENTATION=-